jgi:hypothetical protein
MSELGKYLLENCKPSRTGALYICGPDFKVMINKYGIVKAYNYTKLLNIAIL